MLCQQCRFYLRIDTNIKQNSHKGVPSSHVKPSKTQTQTVEQGQLHKDAEEEQEAKICEAQYRQDQTICYVQSQRLSVPVVNALLHEV